MRIAVVALCLLAGVAHAETPAKPADAAAKPADAAATKPSKDDAAKTVAKWYEAVDGVDDYGPAIALTASSFLSSVYDENSESGDAACKLSTATTAAKIKKAVKCIAKFGVDKPSETSGWKEWSAKVAKKSMVGIKRQKKKLDALAKTSTVLSYHMDCAGSESQIVVGVTNEGGTPKVSAILYESIFCGE